MKLTNLAVDRATTVLVIVIMICLLGVSSYMSLPREAAPDVTIPYILVTTSYTGVSPEDVEKSITIPIEKAVDGISGVEEIRSTSSEGFSIVSVKFESGIDLDTARQKVDAKISEAKGNNSWPDSNTDLSEPIVSEINLSEYPILWVNLRGGAWIDDLRFAGEKLDRMAQLIEDRSVVTDPNELGKLTAETISLLDAAIAKPEGLSEKDLGLLKMAIKGVKQLGPLLKAAQMEGPASDAAALGALGTFLKLHTDFQDDLAEQLKERLSSGAAMAPGRILTEIRSLAIDRLRMASLLCGEMAGNELLRLESVAGDLEDIVESNPNVLDAEVIGGIEREIRIELDPDRLAAYRIPVTQVLQLVARENVSITGGATKIGRSKFTIRFDAEFSDPMDLTRLMARTPGGKELYLTDVADVVYGFKEHTTHSRLDGVPSVTLSIQKRSGTNAIDTIDWVKEKIDAHWKTSRPVGIEFSYTGDQSKIIRTMVEDLENNILSGMILVLVVIFFSMGGRNALFVGIAIPLSMLIGFATLQMMGVTLNMIVLFSLTLSLGMLVDNAIVIVENIYRHLQEGFPLREAAKRGAGQVAWPIISSTATTVAAFAPMLFWPGMIGEFMRYLPMTVIIVLLSSLFVAIIINPAVCGRLMKLKKNAGLTDENNILTAVRNGTPVKSRFLRAYGHVIGWAIRRRWTTLGIALAGLVVSVTLYRSLGLEVEFFPESDPQQGFIQITAPEGTTLEATDAIIRKVEQRVLKYLARPNETDPKRNIETVLATTGFVGQGGLFGGGGASGSNEGRITFEFIDYLDRKITSQKTIDTLRREVADIHGARIVVEQEKEGPSQEAPVVIEITGDRFGTLEDIKKKIVKRIKGTPGLVDLRDDYVQGRPELKFEVDRKRAPLLGLDTSTIAGVIKTAVGGAKVGIWRDANNEEIDMVVRLKDRYRNNPKKIEQLYITSAPGGRTPVQVPLANLATWKFTSGRGRITRIDQKRTITISGNNQPPASPNDALKAVQKRLDDFALPTGYAIDFTGEKEEQDKAQRFLLTAGLAAVLLIWLILVTQFDSLAMPAVIISSVALSLIGVFFGLWITNTAFVIIMTGIGVISLSGVVVNNGIVLVDYIRHLHRNEGLTREQALICGGMTRLRPVLLTAITTILGLIPMATGISFDFHNFQLLLRSESSEWWGPMANAVIFGLGFATVLTLVVVPALYSLLDGAAERVRSSEQEDVKS